MLVEMRSGKIAIVAISNFNHNETMICWDNGSCLYIVDYDNDLIYKDPKYREVYTIDKIYSLGSFYNPYSMSKEDRTVKWNRFQEGFSTEEISKARVIKKIVNFLDGHQNIDSNIFVINDYGKIRIVKEDVAIEISDSYFPNLKPHKFLNLDDIINGEILQ